MAKEIKPSNKLLKLEKLLDVFETGSVQPEELMEVSESLLGIIKENQAALLSKVETADSDSKERVNNLKSDLAEKMTLVREALVELQSSKVSKTEIEKAHSNFEKEINRIVSLIPELPEEFDATDIYNSLEDHKKVIASLSELILGENIRNALESLPEGEKLAIEAIEGLREELDKRIQNAQQTTAIVARNLYQFTDITNASTATDGQVLTANGDGTYTFETPSGGGVSDGDKGDITVSGSGSTWTINDNTIGLDELSATGTPSASTFLRGDNTWATPAGSGDMTAAVYDPAAIAEQLVGLTAAQTLTNKTIDATANTITNIDETSLDASVNASLDLADSASQPGHTHTESDITDLKNYEIKAVANGSLTAALDTYYVCVSNSTFTDPTPAEGEGFAVFVRNGTATVGGTGYSTAGTIVHRIFHSGAWANYVYNVSSTFATAAQGALADSAVQDSSTDTLTNKTINGDNNTISNLDIGNEVDWAAADDVTTASAFETGDKVLIYEAGVGMRKVDYDDLPAGSGSAITALPNNTTVADTDLVVIVDDPGGTPATEKRTIAEIGTQIVNTSRVTSAGAVMDSEVSSLSGIKTLTVPDSTTISAAAATVTDDATVADMVNTLGGATSTGTGGLVRATSPSLTTPNIGAATGTSLALGGVAVPTISSTNTFTNKRITKRTGTTTSSATPTINTDDVDEYYITAQAVDITSFTTNLSGTPTLGQTLFISVIGTAARAITWGASFANGPVALPTTTVTTTQLSTFFKWDGSVWRCYASGSTV